MKNEQPGRNHLSVLVIVSNSSRDCQYNKCPGWQIVNRIPVTAPILGQDFRVLFTGAYLPQKTDLAPPLETQYVSVQKHVLPYYVKISEECFVWAAPTLLRGGPYLKNEEQHFERSREVRILNPARVKARGVWHDWGIFFSNI
jgi:hypothetical protein